MIISNVYLRLLFNYKNTNCRSKRVLENRQNFDDDRIENLEHELKLSKAVAADAEKKYEEVVFKFSHCNFQKYKNNIVDFYDIVLNIKLPV